MRLATVWSILWLGFAGMLSPAAAAEDGKAYGPQLEGFEYPWPVAHFSFMSHGQALDMAYMDVKPTSTSMVDRAAVARQELLCSDVAGNHRGFDRSRLSGDRSRQIGFCKSTKPAHYQYTFQQLAGNTRALIASLGIDRVTLSAIPSAEC